MADQNFNVKSGFFNSINSDRLYNAEDMNRPYKRIIADGVFATQSGNPSSDLQAVSAGSGMNIIVKAGQGIFAAKWFENPMDITITIPSNTDLQPRRDSIIAQVDTRQAGRVGRIVHRTGISSSNPQPPAIGTTEGVIEYRLANIYVSPSAQYIGNDAIVDLRGSSECPWVTSLIKQVDTSTLWNQWNAAYAKHYDDVLRTCAEFMETLTEELKVDMNIVKLESTYTSISEVTEIPINIQGFDKTSDVLEVYINGLKVVENSRFTISNDNTKIILTPSITSGQKVNFVVYKALVGATTQSVAAQITALSNAVSTLTSDSGWINFTLEGGATAYDSSNTPGVRKYGNRVNLRGAFKGVTSAGVTVCTLPTSYKPSMDYIFTTAAIANGNITATVTMKVSAADGTIKLFAKNGTISATDMVSIATDFIIG